MERWELMAGKVSLGKFDVDRTWGGERSNSDGSLTDEESARRRMKGVGYSRRRVPTRRFGNKHRETFSRCAGKFEKAFQFAAKTICERVREGIRAGTFGICGLGTVKIGKKGGGRGGAYFGLVRKTTTVKSRGFTNPAKLYSI